jgi:hypothetical protein
MTPKIGIYPKIKKSIFSLANANISQLFLLDKDKDKVSVDKVYNAEHLFCIATLYRKIGRKVTFEFGGP